MTNPKEIQKQKQQRTLTPEQREAIRQFAHEQTLISSAIEGVYLDTEENLK